MRKHKTLQELTLKDNFLFAAVMMEQENCKELLELALDVKIQRIEVNTEKSIVYHPEYKGIRLDVFAQDEHNTRFNVEMQVARQSLEKRARYYHSQMDMELLMSGGDYGELPDCYVLFVCDFDPFGLKKYRYTVRHTFVEDESFTYRDGSSTVFLSTKGENSGDVSERLVKLMKFIASGVNESMSNFEDAYVTKLQETVKRIKASREMGERYMLFEEMLRDERAEGRAEGKAEGKAEGLALAILNILGAYGQIPEELNSSILSVRDADVLEQHLKSAVQAKSISEFRSMTNL